MDMMMMMMMCFFCFFFFLGGGGVGVWGGGGERQLWKHLNALNTIQAMCSRNATSCQYLNLKTNAFNSKSQETS